MTSVWPPVYVVRGQKRWGCPIISRRPPPNHILDENTIEGFYDWNFKINNLISTK